MRYSKSETTHILGIFNTGNTVTIDVYRLSDNTKVVDSAACSEIGSTGVFSYEFSQTITQKEEFLWIMTNGEYSKYGKIIWGGYMDAISNDINNHRNSVEPKIDAPISSRSSHTPANVWNYPNRELTNPDNYKADISALALESTVQTIKSKTDNLPDNPASLIDINNAKADIILQIETNKTLIEELLDIEQGNWEIKNNQMIFYKRDGSELMRFDLYNKSGNPTEIDVFKRVRI